jgi:hypothetical protein
MPKQQELFTLIKSLSRNEKRYFKLFCGSMGDGSNYLRLFTSIDKQEQYNEAALKKKFTGEAFTKQLHTTKNYLRILILKSLRDFHAGISKNAELKDLLRNVEILFNKELFDICKNELARAEKLAAEYELNAGMFEIMEWRRRIEQLTHPNSFEMFEKTLVRQQQSIEVLFTTNRYWQLTNNLTSRLSAGKTPDSPYDSLLNNATNARTIEEKVLHYNSLYFKHLVSGNSSEAEASLFTLLTLLEENPKHLQHNMSLYASSANNLISFLVFMKKYDSALQLIGRAKANYQQWKLVSENKTLLKQLLRTYNIELEIYRDGKNYAAQRDFLENIDAFINENEGKMPPEYLLSFSFQLAYINFMCKKYSRALYWVNRVLNNRFEGQRSDLQIQVRLLNLMIHFEQQNIFVLRHFVDSTKRYMNKVAEIQPHELTLLKFFSKIGQAFPHQYKALFTDLYSQLFPENSSAATPASVLDFIDYKTWIEEKTGA